jgi:hypothetical protein
MEKMNLSSKLIDFTKQLLNPDPTKRPTISEALTHSWFTSLSTDTEKVERRKAPLVPEPKRSSFENGPEEEPLENDVYERISQRAYNRLLRWIDASQLEEEETELEQYSMRRRRSRDRSYRRLLEGAELKERAEDIVIRVHAEPRGQAPAILTPMSSVSVEEGSLAVLKCAVHLPRPRRPVAPLDHMSNLQISWSLNGRELNLPVPTNKFKQITGQHYTPTYDPETGNVRLHISEATMYDAGTYSVTVKGRYGEISDSANLKVYGKLVGSQIFSGSRFLGKRAI